MAEQVGESKTQIQRYIRLTELEPEILEKVDEGKIGLRPAVEIKVVGDHGEQSDARTLNAVPDQFRDKARKYNGMQNLEAVLEMGKKIFRQAFSVVLNLYVFAFKVIWEILKRIFRAIEEMREEENYRRAEIR